VIVQIKIPEEMREIVVSISHTPEWLLWSFQNNSQNLDMPLTRRLPEITKQFTISINKKIMI